MGNRYDDERYGRNYRPGDNRGRTASEARHPRDWGHESDSEVPGHRDFQSRDLQGHDQSRDLQGHDFQSRDLQGHDQSRDLQGHDFQSRDLQGYDFQSRDPSRDEPRRWQRSPESSHREQSYADTRPWQQSRSPWPDYGSRAQGPTGYEGNRPRTGTLPEWGGGPERAREYERRYADSRPYPQNRNWQGQERHETPPRADRNAWEEGWETDRAPWRSGAGEREAPHGYRSDRDEGHSQHHRHGIAGAFDAIRNAFRGIKGYTRSDERIREDVCDRVDHLSEQHGMDVSDVEVRVQNGEVTLAGSIDDRSFKHRVENEAAGISGVRNVHNEIRVRRTSLNLEGRSNPSAGSSSPTADEAQPTAVATAGALSSGMIGTGGAPSSTEKPRTPNGTGPQTNR